MRKRVLLLGSTGKMGIALADVFSDKYEVIGKNSRDFDATDFEAVRRLINENKPDILINTVAFLGIDPCELEPQKALQLNALLPKLLAKFSNEYKFLLVHFSTDAVFNNKKNGFYSEFDNPAPLNIYGFTKFGGDCFVEAISKKYYIFRISVLFGETQKDTQFVEKMLNKAILGDKVLRVSDDIISSPTYSRDVAKEIRRILEKGNEFGIYHLANKGKGSLFDLIKEVVRILGLDVKVEPASYKNFPYLGIKNTSTPLKSKKLKSLRPWKNAVNEYCQRIKEKYRKDGI